MRRRRTCRPDPLLLAEAFLLGREHDVRLQRAVVDLGSVGFEYVRLARAAGRHSRVWDTARRMIAARVVTQQRCSGRVRPHKRRARHD